MGIANQQILSHLSIDDIPKSMLTNGGGSIVNHTTDTENQIQQSNGSIDYTTSPSRETAVVISGGEGGGGGEVNEKNGEP